MRAKTYKLSILPYRKLQKRGDENIKSRKGQTAADDVAENLPGYLERQAGI